MLEFWNKLKKQVIELVGRMSPSQKLSLGALVAVLVVSLVLLVAWSAGSSWTPLFAEELDMKQKLDIQKVLTSAGIEYKDAAGYILVPSGERNRILAQVMQEVSLPENKEFYSWLDVESMGTTPTNRSMRFLVSREKHLASNIASHMPGILSATVLINYQKKRLIFNDSSRSTASVIIKLKRGVKALKSGTPLAIARLVANSIGNLKSSDVNIVANGQYYPIHDENSLEGYSTRQQEMKAAYEAYYRKKTQEALEMYLPGSIVIPDVTLKFEKSTTHIKDTNLEDSRDIEEKETVTSTGASAGTRTGVKMNFVGPGPAGKGEGSTFKSMRSKIKPVGGKLTETSTDSVSNNIEKVTLFVTASLEAAIRQLPSAVRDKFDETDPAHMKALEAKKEHWKKGIKNCTGAKLLDITLNFARREVPAEPEPELSFGEKVAAFLGVHWGEIALIMLAAGSIALITVNIRRSMPRVSVQPAGAIPGLELIAGKTEGEEEAILPEPEVTREEKELGVMRDRISEAAAQEPAMMANLLRTWLLSGE
jgi:flagellar biosynthesis/type III secretory pathway M-ring protein FliF/YscJ